jgi:hypothetical protein
MPLQNNSVLLSRTVFTCLIYKKTEHERSVCTLFMWESPTLTELIWPITLVSNHQNTGQWVEKYSIKQLKLNTQVSKMIKIMVDTNLWWHCYSCPHDYCYWWNPQCTSQNCRKTEVVGYSAPRHSLHHYVSHTASTFFINN